MTVKEGSRGFFVRLDRAWEIICDLCDLYGVVNLCELVAAMLERLLFGLLSLSYSI